MTKEIDDRNDERATGQKDKRKKEERLKGCNVERSTFFKNTRSNKQKVKRTKV